MRSAGMGGDERLLVALPGHPAWLAEDLASGGFADASVTECFAAALAIGGCGNA